MSLKSARKCLGGMSRTRARLPALACRVILSRRGLCLPCGRPTGSRPGPRRGFHVPHERPAAGVGASYIPGTAMLARPIPLPRPAPAATQRPVPAPRWFFPTSRASHNETSTEVYAIHPSGLPLACDPRLGQGSLGFSPSFGPRRCQRRTSGWGQACEHLPGTTLSTSVDPPIRELNRTVQLRVARSLCSYAELCREVAAHIDNFSGQHRHNQDVGIIEEGEELLGVVEDPGSRTTRASASFPAGPPTRTRPSR